MHIDGATRLNQVLDAVPGALEYIVGLNPHDFGRLRNPILRRYMAHRISLARVAAMAHVSEPDFLAHLRVLAGVDAAPSSGSSPLPVSPPDAPAWLTGVARAAVHWVDLLPIDEAQGDPFPSISLAVRQLAPGAVLGIRHRWEPQPLYDIWLSMDLEWFAEQPGPDEWHIFVYRPPDVAAFAIKPVVGTEVGHLPGAEVVPRIVGVAQQLEPGQALEIGGLTADNLQAVRGAAEQALGAGFIWSAGAPKPRITRQSPEADPPT